jgi:hypothetical protein
MKSTVLLVLVSLIGLSLAINDHCKKSDPNNQYLCLECDIGYYLVHVREDLAICLSCGNDACEVCSDMWTCSKCSANTTLINNDCLILCSS